MRSPRHNRVTNVTTWNRPRCLPPPAILDHDARVTAGGVAAAGVYAANRIALLARSAADGRRATCAARFRRVLLESRAVAAANEAQRAGAAARQLREAAQQVDDAIRSGLAEGLKTTQARQLVVSGAVVGDERLDVLRRLDSRLHHADLAAVEARKELITAKRRHRRAVGSVASAKPVVDEVAQVVDTAAADIATRRLADGGTCFKWLARAPEPAPAAVSVVTVVLGVLGLTPMPQPGAPVVPMRWTDARQQVTALGQRLTSTFMCHQALLEDEAASKPRVDAAME